MAGPGTLYQEGDHASRPVNGAGCVLYACTDHGLVYRDDGSSWTTWATLGGDVSAHTGDTTDAHDASAISLADVGGNTAETDVEGAIDELYGLVGSGAGGPENGLFVPSSTIDMSAADVSNITATPISGYGYRLVTSASGYWDVASAIGTGDFDVCCRVIWHGLTMETSSGDTPLLLFYVKDASRTGSTQLACQVYGVTDGASTTSMGWQGVVGASGTSGLVYGMQFPSIYRLKRVGTTITYYRADWTVEGIPVWSQVRGTTSSLNVGRIGVAIDQNNATAVVQYIGNV